MGDRGFEISDNLPKKSENRMESGSNLKEGDSKVPNSLRNYSTTKIDEKMENQRSKAINEILTSEISYLKHLEMLIENFMNPLKENNILTSMDYNTIFGNIETIYNINEELLNQLKKDLSDYAAAFLKLAPFLKLYSVYAYDYKKSIVLLENLKMFNPEFRQFLEEQEIKVQMKLPSLLITPIQRIPRYRLLLKQVLEHTPSHYSDYNRILDSLKRVESTASHMNSLVEEQENTENMLRIQKSLHESYPCIIKVGRKLIKEGMLMKMSQKKNKFHPRYFVLMSDILMYCKSVKSDPKLPNSLICCCILPINKCKITILNDKGLFGIDCEDEHIFLYSENEKDSTVWQETLQKAIDYYLNCRKTLRKESSARKPARKRRLMEYEQLNISPGILRQKRMQEIGEDIFYGKGDSDEEFGSRLSIFSKKSKKRPLSEHLSISVQTPKRVKFSKENEIFNISPNKSYISKKIQTKISTATSGETISEKENLPQTTSSRIQNAFNRVKNFVQRYFQS